MVVSPEHYLEYFPHVVGRNLSVEEIGHRVHEVDRGLLAPKRLFQSQRMMASSNSGIRTLERASVPLSFPPAPPIIASILAGGPGSRDLQYSNLETDSLAVFGEVTWEIVDDLELTGGLRYTADRKTYQGTVLNLFPSTLPDPDPLPTT